MAKVNQIDLLTGHFGHESVLRGARQIDHSDRPRRPARSVAGHHVCIHIDRVNGVHDGDAILVAENVEDIAAVALEPSETKISSSATSSPQSR